MKKKLYIILLAMFMFVLVNVSVSATINDSVIAYWSFDDVDITNDVLSEPFNNLRMGLNCSTGANGSINQACSFDGVAEFARVNDSSLLDLTENYTVSMWINGTNLGDANNEMLFFKRNPSSPNNGWGLIDRGTNFGAPHGFHWVHFNDATGIDWIPGVTLNNNVWNHYLLRYNRTHLTVFVNSVFQFEQNITTDVSANTEDLLFGCANDVGGGCAAGTFAGASIDEVVIYNRSLLQSEIDDLSNRLVPQVPAALPSLILSTDLVSGINQTENPFTFNFSGIVVNTNDIFNCSLFLNSTINQTLSNVNISNTQSFGLTYGGQEAGFDVNVTCTNIDTSDTFVRTNVFIDSILPNIVQTTIVNNTVFFRGLDAEITPIVTCSDNNLFACNMTLIKFVLDVENNTVNNTFVENIIVNSLSINFTFDVNNQGEGLYQIRTQAFDSHTNNNVRELQWFTSTDVIHIDNDIEFSGDLKEELTTFVLSEEGDRYKFKITWNNDALYHSLTIKTNQNKLIYRPDDGYLGHFVVLGLNRWIDFEGDDVNTVVVTSIDDNEYLVEVWHDTLTDEIEFESIGDLNRKDISWFFTIDTFVDTNQLGNGQTLVALFPLVLSALVIFGLVLFIGFVSVKQQLTVQIVLTSIVVAIVGVIAIIIVQLIVNGFS